MATFTLLSSLLSGQLAHHPYHPFIIWLTSTSALHFHLKIFFKCAILFVLLFRIKVLYLSPSSLFQHPTLHDIVHPNDGLSQTNKLLGTKSRCLILWIMNPALDILENRGEPLLKQWLQSPHDSSPFSGCLAL